MPISSRSTTEHSASHGQVTTKHYDRKVARPLGEGRRRIREELLAHGQPVFNDDDGPLHLYHHLLRRPPFLELTPEPGLQAPHADHERDCLRYHWHGMDDGLLPDKLGHRLFQVWRNIAAEFWPQDVIFENDRIHVRHDKVTGVPETDFCISERIIRIRSLQKPIVLDVPIWSAVHVIHRWCILSGRTTGVLADAGRCRYDCFIWIPRTSTCFARTSSKSHVGEAGFCLKIVHIFGDHDPLTHLLSEMRPPLRSNVLPVEHQLLLQLCRCRISDCVFPVPQRT